MPHISHTQIQTLLKCVNQWHERYELEIVIPPPIRVIEGRVPHVTAQHDLCHKIATGELLEDDVIADMARDTLNEEWGKEGVSLNDDEKTIGDVELRGRAVDASVQLSSLHHKVLAPTITPVSVERKFEITIATTGYDLLGYIDCEDQTETGIVVRDLKTTAKKPAATMAERSQQLSVYALAVWAEKKVIPQVALDFIIRRKVPGIDRQVATRSERNLLASTRRIEAVIRQIQSGIITPAPEGAWWCDPKWCGYWSRCEFV